MSGKLLITFACLIPSLLFGQEFSFSTFGETQGINQPYIYNIQQDNKGFLCFTTSEGAFKYDGILFERIDHDGKVNEPFYKSLLIEKEFTILGSNTGGIYVYKDGLIQGKLVNNKNTSPVVQLIKNNNKIYALHQNGTIIELDVNLEKQTITSIQQLKLPPNAIYNSIIVYKKELVATSSEGLIFFQIAGSKISNLKTVKVNNDGVECAEELNGSLFIGTQSSGLYIYENSKVQKINLGEEFDNVSIKSMFGSDLTSMWIAINEKGVFEVKKNTSSEQYYVRSSLTESKGLPSKFVTKIFIDKESNLWLGTLGQGLNKLNSKFFIHYKLDKYGLGKTVYSTFNDGDQYSGMGDGILQINFKNDSIFPWKYNSQLPKSKVKAIVKSGKTWMIGTEEKGVYILREGSSKLSYLKLSDDNLSNNINHIEIFKDVAYISTMNGLYVYNLKDNITKYYSTSLGLPHNNVNSTFAASDGKIYIAVLANSIYYLENDEIKNVKILNGFGSMDALCFEEDRKGNLWIGTNGQGLFKLSNKKLTRFSAAEGLHSDYIYQVSLDKRNMLWCAHRGGLSRMSGDSDEIVTFDYRNDVAMDFSLNAVNSDNFNNLWFGANEGLVQYSILQDKLIDYKPSPVLTSIILNDSVFKHTDLLTLEYRKNKIKVNFRTVSLSNSEGVYYQYRLKNLDEQWSEPSKENSATFSQLLDGEYELEVRSRIGNGDWSATKVILKINVPEPIWKKWWFSLLGLLLIVTILVIVIKYRTKNLIGQKKRLEEILTHRTAEIELQKNKLKQQYLETQDSIDYGVKIQSALLPDLKKLRKSIPDSFILLQPKDKVSGDFYYFERFGSRIVIAACDATGHGVPGAFISLIGFVAMKEIIHREDIDTPSKLLSELDYEINNTLRQYERPNDGRDGMDMAVCEFDLKTLNVKMASALRPIWILRGNEFEKIRFNKASIGGGYDYEKKPKKEFETVEKQLQKGDIIYLFSDGIIDQFGGPRNKKMMARGFQNLLKENSHLPMQEQHDVLLKHLNDWKGDFEQTDDIMVIGLRL